MKTILALLGSVVLVSSAAADGPPKKIVRSQADLPRFSYPLPGLASTLVGDGGPAFDAFAARVRADVESVLRDYQIEDHATLRALLDARLSLEELAGEDAAALRTLDEIRGLQDKPAAKLLSGIAMRAMIEAAQETHARQGPAFTVALKRRYAAALRPLPWDLVQNAIKSSHVGARIFTASVALADVMTEIDPAARTSHALDSEEAWSLLATRVDLQWRIPMGPARAEVLEAYIAAHPTPQRDIWTGREVTLSPDQTLTPVAVAIWDSGIDPQDFPGQMFEDPPPAPSGTHGVAIDDQGRPSRDWLYPLTPAQRAAYPEFRLLVQGHLDIEHGLDSPAAQALVRKYRTLAPEELHDYFAQEKVLGFYVHGTHCAGIAARGNPAVRLVVARFNDELPDLTFPPTEDWVRRIGEGFQRMAEFFRTRHVRVVNLSWGDQPSEFETWLDKTGGGGQSAERKARAERLFQLWRTAVRQAMESCPDVLFITAAGNSDSNPGFDQDVPASLHLPNLIAVGAVDEAGEETSFTSYGDTVVVDANGYEVDSTVPGRARLPLSGTSMASPNVVNLAAKLFALDPKLTPARVIDLIRRGATASADGRLHLIDEKRSVALLQEDSAGPDPRETPVPAIATSLGTLPGVGELPDRPDLPDVMTFADGSRVTTRDQWEKRRAEMRRILEYYAVGHRPPPPGNVKGRVLHSETVGDGQVAYRLVHLTFGPDEKLGLDIGIFTPAAGGPFPAIISQSFTPPGGAVLPRLPQGPGQGRGTDALLPPAAAAQPAVGDGPPRKFGGPQSADAIARRSAEVFRRGYALVMYNDNDCAEDTTLRMPDGSWAFRTTRLYPAYPGYDWGILAGWAWGASRIADYLQTDPAIDGGKLIITGASRAGKSAMIAAAFDDRLMAAPVVTGGGGIGAYRLAGGGGSETLDVMQKKYPNWFSPHLHEFWGQREKLPFDEHWFLALCAPRPFIALEGNADVISSPVAVKASVAAALAAYALYGAQDRLAVHYSHHAHAFTPEDWTALMDFADRHLRVQNVRDFGAAGDGRGKDTRAFQAALDTCAVTGGGEVVVPAGTYLIGSIQIGDRTTLRLETGAVLKGSPDLADYPLTDVRWEGRWQIGRRGLLYASEVRHTAILGPGRIEGSPWRTNAPDGTRNPVVIEPVNCDDVRWEAFTVVQGGHWATHPVYCSGLRVRGVTITSRRDGIDVDSCRDVRIEDCAIRTGDDSISLKSGRGMDGARLGRPCEDVLISHCILEDSHFACVGIGSETSGGVRNVRIEHCRCVSGREAIYIKTRSGRAGANDNISGEDLDVTAPTFLRINLTEGGNRSTVDDPVDGPAGYPTASRLSFRHIRVKVNQLVRGNEVSPLQPVRGLTLEDIRGTCTKGIVLANTAELSVRDVNVTGLTGPLLSIEPAE